MNNKPLFKYAVLGLSLVLVACTGSGTDESSCREREDGDTLNVLATTPMIGEFVNQIGGDNINLTVLMPPEADPHSYDPSPQDATKIADADIVFYTGLNYEPAPLRKLLESSACSPSVLAEVGESVFPVEFKESGHDDHGDEEGHDDEEEGEDEHAGHDHGEYDPHFWFDPNRVSYAADFIKGKLIQFDPDNQADYDSSFDTFATELRGLVNEVIELIGMIPSQNRMVITTHESLGYLEAKFGLEVLATIIPDLDSSEEVSPSDIAEVIEVIEENDAKILFVEAETPSVYAETIAQETGIKLVSGLYVETLKPNQSYSEFLITNVELIVNSLKDLD
jgi:ABC-type Zn uptake system ZnuABC Zn-binding protein ZnuA